MNEIKRAAYGRNVTTRIGWPPVSTEVFLTATRMEIALALTGLALSLFMALHMGLLLSVMLGTDVMNRLALFLERTYLLQATAPVLVFVLFAHVGLGVRKLPRTSLEQIALFKSATTLWHWSTWMWLVQIVTGAALLALIAIHLWAVLTDLPIQAHKSGIRVHGIYLWFYVPLVVLVETHIAAGLYRIAVKWAPSEGRWMHYGIRAWTILFLSLGFAVLAAFYRIGAAA